jgi:hypothetical protein
LQKSERKKSARSGYLKNLKEELSNFMKGLAKKTGEVFKGQLFDSFKNLRTVGYT